MADDSALPPASVVEIANPNPPKMALKRADTTGRLVSSHLSQIAIRQYRGRWPSVQRWRKTAAMPHTEPSKRGGSGMASPGHSYRLGSYSYRRSSDNSNNKGPADAGLWYSP